jgi:hypothetical protein
VRAASSITPCFRDNDILFRCSRAHADRAEDLALKDDRKPATEIDDAALACKSEIGAELERDAACGRSQGRRCRGFGDRWVPSEDRRSFNPGKRQQVSAGIHDGNAFWRAYFLRLCDGRCNGDCSPRIG